MRNQGLLVAEAPTQKCKVFASNVAVLIALRIPIRFLNIFQ